MTLVPAYGRDYKSKKEVLQAWEGGKDFRICDISSLYNGSYCNVRDFAGKSYSVTIRYNKLQHVVVIKK